MNIKKRLEFTLVLSFVGNPLRKGWMYVRDRVGQAMVICSQWWSGFLIMVELSYIIYCFLIRFWVELDQFWES